MALVIREYAVQGQDGANRLVPAAQEPALTSQSVAIGGTSAQSSAFNDSTRLILIVADVDTNYDIGSNPTATASTGKLPADALMYFSVEPGHKIAVKTV